MGDEADPAEPEPLSQGDIDGSAVAVHGKGLGFGIELTEDRNRENRGRLPHRLAPVDGEKAPRTQIGKVIGPGTGGHEHLLAAGPHRLAVDALETEFGPGNAELPLVGGTRGHKGRRINPGVPHQQTVSADSLRGFGKSDGIAGAGWPEGERFADGFVIEFESQALRRRAVELKRAAPQLQAKVTAPTEMKEDLRGRPPAPGKGLPGIAASFVVVPALAE